MNGTFRREELESDDVDTMPRLPESVRSVASRAGRCFGGAPAQSQAPGAESGRQTFLKSAHLEAFVFDMMWPGVPKEAVASVSTEQMRRLDRLAVEARLFLLQMMENAAVRLSEVAWSIFSLSPAHRVVVLAGGGSNGGGALAAARHLSNRGADVAVVLDREPSALTDAARQQLEVLEWTSASVSDDPPSAPHAIIDGLIGYGLRGSPKGKTAALIEWANRNEVPICALDVPSGLNATTGVSGRPCIRATVTLTLALPKTGLLTPGAGAVVGSLLLADISIPAGVYESAGLIRPGAFGTSPIVAIE